MIRFPRTIVLAVSLFPLFSCDPSALDKAVEKAPVRSIGAPDGYNGEVGNLVVPLAPPADNPAVAARFVAAARTGRSSGTGGVMIAEFDAKGEVKATAIPAANLGGDFPPAGSMAATSEGAILIGTPAFGDVMTRGRIYRLIQTPGVGGGVGWMATVFAEPMTIVNGVPSADYALGSGVASGPLGGPSPVDDYVAVSDRKLSVFTDGGAARVVFPAVEGTQPLPDCAVVFDPQVNDRVKSGPRPLAVADVLTGGQSEILVGLPRSVGTGQVTVLRLDAAGAIECVPTAVVKPPATTTALASLPNFGAAIAVGDFDGDGKRDLAVGAPQERVFIYFGPLDVPRAPLEIAVPVDTGANANFGLRLAASDLVPGTIGDELIVSAPDAAVGAAGSAGKVFVFSGAGVLLTSVVEKDSEANASFGSAIASVRFRSPGCADPVIAASTETSVLLVGAITKVLAHYRVPLLSPPGTVTTDPRCLPAAK